MGDDAFDRLLLGLDWTFVAGEDHQLGAGSWLGLREPGVLQVRAGLVRVRGTAGSRTDLAAGDLLFTPTGVRHEVHALAPTELRLARLGANHTPAAAGQLPDRIVLTDLARDEPLAVDLLADIVTNVAERPANPVCDRATTLLCSMLLRAWRERGCAPDRWLLRLSDPDIARALAALHETPGAEWTVAALARVALSSRSGFAERFRAAVGVPPLRYLAEVRMRWAESLLRREELTIGQIAREVGYGSTAAFGRAFDRHRGTTPQRWREAQRAGAGSVARAAASEPTSSTAPSTPAAAAIR
ncbi:AraC-like DNA-binding protein [Naumannella cuiyingiana]|uniref:AraC-like DNA-binding protein n=1 Tax=Naumannella cuiyingiana TaxID=1347891 RepID=A0A7Z0D808_9ACTN|nr:AraC family transcriptional regulator [Naumannella cuiyingiana]NYI70449.1 AraC-like DNA-binding protein [Naumannella cuiyingiana]